VEGRTNLRTIFSTQPFVELWCRSAGFRVAPYELAIPGVPSAYGVSSRDRWGRRSIALGPNGLYAGILSGAKCLDDVVRAAMRRLRRLSVASFRWNVRFDHGDLAATLGAAGLSLTTTKTHVLVLEGDYDSTFSRYNATVRNQVRRSRREGVTVRHAIDADDIRLYYRMHQELASQKQGYGKLYPLELFQDLLMLGDDIRLLIAHLNGLLVAGGFFFRDGNSLFYWHGASDRRFSKFFPACSVIDHGIRWACEEGLATVNLGGSAGIHSLETFKSFWGARPTSCWSFEWHNPLWRSLHSIKGRLQLRTTARPQA
jgi:predicted N-acyltransferase